MKPFKHKTAATLFTAAALYAGMAFAAPPEQTATIVDSGATNFPGYNVTVGRDGTVKAISGGTGIEMKPQKAPSPAAIKQLFADLDTMQPLGALPEGLCGKSASMGHTVTVEYAGQTSPDLTCPGDARGKTLSQDARAVLPF